MKISKTAFENVTLYNCTHYRTNDLRRLVIAAMRECGVYQDGTPCRVDIEYARQTGVRECDGATFYGGGYMPHWSVPRRRWRLCLPPKLDALTPAQVCFAVRIAVHEIGHTQGLEHADMLPWWDLAVPWAEGLVVRAQRRLAAATVPVTSEARSEAREAHVRAKVVELEQKIEDEKKASQRRLKALRTRLKGWRTKVRYYDRKKR